MLVELSRPKHLLTSPSFKWVTKRTTKIKCETKNGKLEMQGQTVKDN